MASLKMIISLPSKKWLYLLPVILFGLGAGFSLFYLFSSYEFLRHWFIGLSDCFYRSDTWSSNFFTPAVKAQGNFYAVIGLAGSVLGLAYLTWFFLKGPLPSSSTVSLNVNWRNLLWPSLLILVAVGLWVWGKSMVGPSFDEVFSALHCAGMHPFQTISYYMLPNNHLLFNFTNASIFFFAEDKVVTGRLISLASYLLLSLLVYYWSKKILGKRWLAFLFALVVIIQFPIWGFSFQGRGYELYALAHWLGFISLFKYLRSGKPAWLVANVLATFVGFTVLPTYLYFYSAQIALVALYHVSLKQWGWTFWKYQVGVCFLVFLFYLPVIGFSGIQSITANPYVTPVGKDMQDFFAIAWPILNSYVEYCFSGLSLGGFPLYAILFFLPLGLLLSKKPSPDFWMGVFFIVMVLCVLTFIFVMQRPPFHRTLIGYESIILALAAYASFRLLHYWFGKLRKQFLTWLVFPALLLLLSIHFFTTNPKNVSFYLYFYDINGTHQRISEGMDHISGGSSIYFSDESFYWYYLCQQREYDCIKCEFSNQDYVVIQPREPFPQGAEGRYELYQTVGDYEIYRVKAPNP